MADIVYKVQDDFNAISFGIADHCIQSRDAVCRIVDVASRRIQELEEDGPRPRICIHTSKPPDSHHLQLGVLNLGEHEVHIRVDHEIARPPGIGAGEILCTSSIVVEEPGVDMINTCKRCMRSANRIRRRRGVCRAGVARGRC